MILDNAQIKDYEVEQSGDDIEGGEVSIDTSNMGLFYDMMSKSIYSNPHGSIIRELVSNGFDANTEAVEAGLYPEDTRKPVIIKTYSEENERWLSIQDFGIGISKDRFHSVYLKYLSSTKRQSNKYFGAFGLGSKSPFSYTDVFYILTRFEGKEYYYVMSKGQQATPNWDLLYEKETEEPNGTTVKFIIEGGKFGGDFNKFQYEIINQLRYFDDVYVDGFSSIQNEYKILDYKTFKFRKATEAQSMHIALGKVTYPIDWNVLKRQQIKIPVGVKFDIGEIMITSNRESIRYNDEVIDIINKRIDECLKEIQSLATSNNFDTIADLKAAQGKVAYNKYIPLQDGAELTIYANGYNLDNTTHYDINIEEPQWTPFAGTPLKVPSDPFLMFRATGAVDEHGSYTSTSSDDKKRKLPRYIHNIYQLSQLHKLYRTNDFKIAKIKMFYLGKLTKEANKSKGTFSDRAQSVIVTKDNRSSLKQTLAYIGLSKEANAPLSRRGRKQYAPMITESYNKTSLFQLYRREMEKEIIRITKSYDRLEIPEDVVAEWKQQFTQVREARKEGEIPMMDYGYDLEKKHLTKLSTLDRGLIVYGGNSDKNQLITIQRLLHGRLNKSNRKRDLLTIPKFKVIGLNNVDLKHMDRENHVALADFVGGHKVFREQITAYYIYKDFNKLGLDWLYPMMPAVKEWYNKLNTFISDTVGNEYHRNAVLESKIVQELLKVAESQGLILKEYVDIVKGLLSLQEDLFLIWNIFAQNSGKLTFNQRKEVAQFIVKKGYSVDPIYFFKPNEEEEAWINSLVKYTKDSKDYYGRNSPEYSDESYEVLLREAYEARKNNNYSLYTPVKSWHKNFQQSSGNKLVKISMLSLTQMDNQNL